MTIQLKSKAAVGFLRVPTRPLFRCAKETSQVSFIAYPGALTRQQIPLQRFKLYKHLLALNVEYVGWIDDDDYTKDFYFSRLLTILDKNPTYTGICARQQIVSKIGFSKKFETTEKVSLGHPSDYHGPALFRADKIKNLIGFFKEFQGVDENRAFAQYLHAAGHILGIWDSFQTFYVR